MDVTFLHVLNVINGGNGLGCESWGPFLARKVFSGILLTMKGTFQSFC